jgi:hypothetical protein
VVITSKLPSCWDLGCVWPTAISRRQVSVFVLFSFYASSLNLGLGGAYYYIEPMPMQSVAIALAKVAGVFFLL